MTIESRFTALQSQIEEIKKDISKNDIVKKKLQKRIQEIDSIISETKSLIHLSHLYSKELKSLQDQMEKTRSQWENL